MSLSPEERETVIQTDDETGKWNIFSIQQKTITRLRNAGIEPVRLGKDGEHYYEDIDFNQISFRKKTVKGNRKPMSDDHKAKLFGGRKNNVQTD